MGEPVRLPGAKAAEFYPDHGTGQRGSVAGAGENAGVELLARWAALSRRCPGCARDLQVRRRVDTRWQRTISVDDRDAVAVGQRSQLFEAFMLLERVAGQLRKLCEETPAERVDADVSARRQMLRQLRAGRWQRRRGPTGSAHARSKVRALADRPRP